MDKKQALFEVQQHLSAVDLANEHIKEIKEALKEEFGKEESQRIVDLARLLNKDKYHSTVENVHGLEDLYAEIMVK